MHGPGRVVVGVSGSPGSLRALRYAEILARARGAALVPVIAWVPPGGDGADRRQPSGQLRRVWHASASQRLRDALLAVWGQVPADPLIQPQVERGPAGWVLVSIACEPDDVLVLGAGRRGTLAWMLFCGVSRYCVAHARCPVILVPPAELASAMRHRRLAWTLRHRTLTPADVVRERGTQPGEGPVRA